MAQGKRNRLSTEQRIDMWRRWQAGESLHEIGRAFGKGHGSIRFLMTQRGGIVPAARLGRFWGVSAFTGKEAVAVAETFTLRLPKSVSATVWSPKQPAKVTEEGAERVYRWTSSQLDLLEDPRRRPEPKPRRSAPSSPKR
jgi:hypothetical protein